MQMIIAASLTVFTLASGIGSSHAQSVAGSGQRSTPPPEVLAQHRAALVAQCPPLDLPANPASLPINVTRWGTTGPRVLVIHGGVQGGLGGGPPTFDRQEALGSQGWRMERVDRPGFGRSPSRGVDDMERDAVWVADMLGDGAHLIAHSWGGGTAFMAAALRPGAVKSLILVEPTLNALIAYDPATRNDPAFHAAVDRRDSLLLAASSPQSYGLGFARSLGTLAPGSDMPNATAAAFEADPVQAARVGCSLLRARIARPEAMHSAAERIKAAGIPVLIVTGGWSATYDMVAEVGARAVRGRHVIVRSPSHFVQMANAEEFNQVADTFMREAESRRRP